MYMKVVSANNILNYHVLGLFGFIESELQTEYITQ
jgi:hypothetical protein